MIVPRNNFLWLTGLLIVPLATVGGLIPSVRFAAVGLIVVALVVAAVDGLLAPRVLRGIAASLPPLVRLSRRRKGSIAIRITHDGVKAKRLRVGVALPPEIESDEEDRWTILPAGSAACHIECGVSALKRGSFTIDRIHLEGVSLIGLWSVRAVSQTKCEIRVYPDLVRESSRTGAQFLKRGGVGVHRHRQVGRGKEFEKLRDYSAGDDYSDIHWKATARRGRPVTKVFQVERTQEVYIIVDSSRLTARPAGDTDTILERFVSASLLVGLAAEREGDLFGLVTFSDRVHGFVRAKRGKAHYGACQETLYALQPRLVSPDFEELCSFLRTRLRRRALLVFLTELDDPVLAEAFERAVGVLRRQHLVLAGMLAPRDARPLFIGPEPESVDEIYERLSGHLAWHGLRQLECSLKRQGVRLSLLDADKLTSQLTSQYLDVKQRQLL